MTITKPGDNPVSFDNPEVNFYLVVLLAVSLHVAFAGSRVTLSLFALSLHASPFTVGLIMSLLALLPMLFSVHAGRIIDRIGVRGPMLGGAAAVICGIVLVVLWPRLETLFVVSALVGSGFMLFHIAANHVAGVVGRPKDRAINFNLLALGFSTSNFLGPMLVGFAIDWVGHRLTFVLLGGFALLTLAGLLVRRIEVPRPEVLARTGEKRRLSDLIRNRSMRDVILVSGVLSMAWDLFTFVVPIHGSRIGLTATQIGVILGCFGAAIFCVRLVLPLFMHRVSEWQMLITAMLAAGTTLFVFPLVTGMPLLALLAFILGIGLGGTQPMIMSMLYSKAPPGRGAEAVGLRTLLINVSQTGMPLLFGALGAAIGMTPVFWAMALCLITGGLVARKR